MARLKLIEEHIEGLILQYSEWLDFQGLIVAEKDDSVGQAQMKNPGEDKRTHEQLVKDFLNEHDGT
jgi:hypothetical protein